MNKYQLSPGINAVKHHNSSCIHSTKPSNSENWVIVACWCSAWWRHQMETSSALLALCAGNSPATGEFPTQRPVSRSFDLYFDLRPNKQLSKQSWGRWFETLSRPLWRHRNGTRSSMLTYWHINPKDLILVTFFKIKLRFFLEITFKKRLQDINHFVQVSTYCLI